MSFSRRLDQPHSAAADAGKRAVPGIHDERRSAGAGVIASGTLACPRCDAPIGIGSGRLSLGDPLRCPFCHQAGMVRDFLSLAAPTRPARVVIRATFA